MVRLPFFAGQERVEERPAGDCRGHPDRPHRTAEASARAFRAGAAEQAAVADQTFEP
ncbi:hypothetical protein ABT340_20700 [Streptosporangium sp. NPDC000239]|uniref:hypothetical protein n=1 Tax=Streptosporangium sp. NPDC000239 TaxID=3154248 RepID=UPI003320CD17